MFFSFYPKFLSQVDFDSIPGAVLLLFQVTPKPPAFRVSFCPPFPLTSRLGRLLSPTTGTLSWGTAWRPRATSPPSTSSLSSSLLSLSSSVSSPPRFHSFSLLTPRFRLSQNHRPICRQNKILCFFLRLSCGLQVIESYDKNIHKVAIKRAQKLEELAWRRVRRARGGRGL